jgi:hypothetical protein
VLISISILLMIITLLSQLGVSRHASRSALNWPGGGRSPAGPPAKPMRG